MSSKMKSKSTKRKAETYESEDGFISNDDGKAPKSKKTKTTTKSTSASEKTAEPTWELDSKKRATIYKWKGTDYINIREYYEKDGEHLPGKKGIMLNLSAYTTFVKAIPAINKKLSEMGYELDLGGDDGEEEEEEEEVKSKKSKAVVKKSKPEKKSKKANIEATSEEEEEEEEEEDDD